MQTMKVKVRDNFVQQFLDIVAKHDSDIQIESESNIHDDPYFQIRQKQLHQDIKEIDSGRAQVLCPKEYDKSMKLFFDNLQDKYANK
ncbi:MAG: hypothetical protein DRG11_00765 [Epsilonproteobacteria bacterium]|nr:MAG: hypothetical protein DRG11_00765 [Campylobacterota bacterium]